jgi:DNA invertase Pin-like site-specific DNA recombinase
MKAIAYARVSTAHQADEGVSLEAQQAKLNAWATLTGHELIGMEIDAGISGKRADNRPALQRAIEIAEREGAVLVTYSLSRLSRSVKDTLAIAERLDKAGANLVSLTEQIDTTSAAGRMMFKMLSVLAEFEREQIGERTKGALAHLRAQGFKTGGSVPFGYDLAAGGKLIENAGEQEALRLIAELRTDGYSLRAIAAELERLGVTTKSGKAKWNPKTLAAIVRKAA